MSAPTMLHRSFTVRLAQGETAPAGEIPVIASSEALDDYGEIIEQSSWRLDRFLRAPVALWQHEAWEDPIGFFRDVRVENGELRATLVPYTGAADPEGKGAAILARYAQGGPISVSVGFCSGVVDTEERDGQRVRVLRECELYEISVVTIGSNPEAVALRAAATRRLRERRTKGTPMTMTEYLAARGMTAEECASAAGMTPDEMTALMGGTAPTEEQVAKLATALGITPEEVSGLFPAPAAAEGEEDKPAAEGEEEKPAAKASPAATGSADDVAAFGRQALEVLGMRSPEAALLRLRTLLDGEKSAKDLAQRVARIEAERVVEKRKGALAAARADGRLTPAREKKLGDYLLKLTSIDALEEYLGTLEPAVDLTERGTPRTPETPAVSSTKGADLYTPEQLDAARAANEQRRASRGRR